MDGIKDFRVPLYMDIAHPNKGFFGYLLRCKCPQPEDVSGNFIFLDDGTDCCVKFPTAKKRRGKSGRNGTAASAVTMIFSKACSTMFMKNCSKTSLTL